MSSRLLLLSGGGSAPVALPDWPTLSSGTLIARWDPSNLPDVGTAMGEWQDQSGNGRHLHMNNGTYDAEVAVKGNYKSVYFAAGYKFLTTAPYWGGSWSQTGSDDVTSNAWSIYIAAIKPEFQHGKPYCCLYDSGGSYLITGGSMASYESNGSYYGAWMRNIGDGSTYDNGLVMASDSIRTEGTGVANTLGGIAMGSRWEAGQASGNTSEVWDSIGKLYRDDKDLSGLSGTPHTVDSLDLFADPGGNHIGVGWCWGAAAFKGKLNTDDHNAMMAYMGTLAGVPA